MGAQHRAQEVVGGAHVRDPIAHGLVDGVLERARAARHPAHLRSQQAHAADVGLLARHVLGPHVDHALQPQQRAHRGRGHAVLAGPRLRHHARLAHPAHEQTLAERVVDLVRARVAQVLALEEHAAAQRRGEPLRLREGRGPAHVVPQARGEVGAESGIAPRLEVGRLQLAQRLHERLRHEPPAVGPEAPRLVGHHGSLTCSLPWPRPGPPPRTRASWRGPCGPARTRRPWRRPPRPGARPRWPRPRCRE